MVNENFAVLLQPHKCITGCKALEAQERSWGAGGAEALEGDAVTISTSLRFLSHGTVPHVLLTSRLFVFLVINVAFLRV